MSDKCEDFYCQYWETAHTCRGCDQLGFEDGSDSVGGLGQRPFCKKGWKLYLAEILPTKEKMKNATV